MASELLQQKKALLMGAFLIKSLLKYNIYDWIIDNLECFIQLILYKGEIICRIG